MKVLSEELKIAVCCPLLLTVKAVAQPFSLPPDSKNNW
jgi:hypothetical protein